RAVADDADDDAELLALGGRRAANALLFVGAVTDDRVEARVSGLAVAARGGNVLAALGAGAKLVAPRWGALMSDTPADGPETTRLAGG
ncbi:hypothetical protein NY412_14530, partial [Enterobacter hormaechei]|uniref:hypothetical protein n=1 Tax=Enterobacter hormaechei TaxID=158836 RepID=UPI0022F11C2B